MEDTSIFRFQLSRDDRLSCRVLRAAGLGYAEIAAQVQCTYKQAWYACDRERATLKKRVGRPPVLSGAQVDELVDFVCFSMRNRRMGYAQLVQAMDFDVSIHAVRGARIPICLYRDLLTIS